MTKLTYDSADYLDRGETSLWRITGTLTADDGTTSTWLHALPVDAMEWRAAEYGIDPSDTATLLDIVMAEPHLTDADWATGEHLYSAPDVDTARRDHVARCATAKWRNRLSTRGPDHPLGPVAAGSWLDPAAVAVKAAHVAAVRARIAARAAVGAADPAARVERLRQRLLHTTSSMNTE